MTVLYTAHNCEDAVYSSLTPKVFAGRAHQTPGDTFVEGDYYEQIQHGQS